MSTLKTFFNVFVCRFYGIDNYLRGVKKDSASYRLSASCVKASKLRWFCATKSIQTVKTCKTNCSPLNCGLSSNVLITLGNFLNFLCLFKTKQEQKKSSGGEKRQRELSHISRLRKGKVNRDGFCATNLSTKNFQREI